MTKHLLSTLHSHVLAVFILAMTVLTLESCGPDKDSDEINIAPEVVSALADITLDEGFSSETISLADVFDDEDGDALTFTANSSAEGVATVSVSGTTLTITEAGIGTSTISVTAEDGNGGSASDSFTVTINEAGSSGNTNPTVSNAIPDQELGEGFGTSTINLIDVFTDAETTMLSYAASSSDEGVVTVNIMGPDLTITEVANGTSTITVTAADGDGGSVSDEFTVTVSSSGSTCTTDNTIDTSRSDCNVTLPYANEVVITVDEGADTRTVVSNNIPDHMVGEFLNADVTEQDFNFTLDYTPAVTGDIFNLLNTNPEYSAVTSAYEFGVALNGVKFDPTPNEPWENPDTGERNYLWNLEPTNVEIGLDCNEAHVQPNGAYHYHGVPYLFFDEMGVDGSGMVLVGWAADGFPVYAQYGYETANDNTSAIVELSPSYRLKEGEREGDGLSEPCGEYNGRFSNDYEYVEGLGDLDECNGRTGVTPEFPEGTYYYVITTDFPKQPRCWKGSANEDFRVF